MVTSILILALSLGLLIVGAEVLVRGAASVARRFGVSSFFIGLTIVGFGTSTPELFASITAALENYGDIAVGNCVGSNIFNIAVILGLTAIIAPIPIQAELVRKEVKLVILVAAVPFITFFTDGMIERWLGILMVLALIVYVARGYFIGRQEPSNVAEEVDSELATATRLPLVQRLQQNLYVQIALIAVGLGLLVLGAKLLVDSAVDIARTLGMSELTIGLTIVAAGTSMPELVTSFVAALRKQSDISVGNVLGSNIFNIIGILGVTSIVKPQFVSDQVLMLDAPVMLLVSLAALPIMMSGRRISRGEGALLVTGYIAYVAVLILFAPSWFATA